MPMQLAIKHQQHGSFWKFRCLICIVGEENEISSEEFIVNDLIVIRLKFKTKDSFSALIPSIIAEKHIKAKDSKVKVKVSCIETDKPYYSEWICKDVAEYREIDKKLLCDICLNNVRTCLLNITVSACKVQENLLVKLYDDVDFTDFNLTSENGSVAVHRAHLAAHSDVFKSMLSREWKETKEGKVVVQGVTVQTLQYLKQYMYLGTLPDDDLLPLLLIAAYYLMDNLKAECVAKIAQTAKPGEWHSLFVFATENNIPELVCAITLINPQNVFEGVTQIMVKEQVSKPNDSSDSSSE